MLYTSLVSSLWNRISASNTNDFAALPCMYHRRYRNYWAKMGGPEKGLSQPDGQLHPLPQENKILTLRPKSLVNSPLGKKAVGRVAGLKDYRWISSRRRFGRRNQSLCIVFSNGAPLYSQRLQYRTMWLHSSTLTTTLPSTRSTWKEVLGGRRPEA